MGTGKRDCKTAAVMGLLNRGPAAVRDMRVQPAGARDIESITAEILEAKRAGARRSLRSAGG